MLLHPCQNAKSVHNKTRRPKKWPLQDDSSASVQIFQQFAAAILVVVVVGQGVFTGRGWFDAARKRQDIRERAEIRHLPMSPSVDSEDPGPESVWSVVVGDKNICTRAMRQSSCFEIFVLHLLTGIIVEI